MLKELPFQPGFLGASSPENAPKNKDFQHKVPCSSRNGWERIQGAFLHQPSPFALCQMSLTASEWNRWLQMYFWGEKPRFGAFCSRQHSSGKRGEISARGLSEKENQNPATAPGPAEATGF